MVPKVVEAVKALDDVPPDAAFKPLVQSSPLCACGEIGTLHSTAVWTPALGKGNLAGVPWSLIP